jgi:hypothetical protein
VQFTPPSTIIPQIPNELLVVVEVIESSSLTTCGKHDSEDAIANVSLNLTTSASGPMFGFLRVLTKTIIRGSSSCDWLRSLFPIASKPIPCSQGSSVPSQDISAKRPVSMSPIFVGINDELRRICVIAGHILHKKKKHPGTCDLLCMPYIHVVSMAQYKFGCDQCLPTSWRDCLPCPNCEVSKGHVRGTDHLVIVHHTNKAVQGGPGLFLNSLVILEIHDYRRFASVGCCTSNVPHERSAGKHLPSRLLLLLLLVCFLASSAVARGYVFSPLPANLWSHKYRPQPAKRPLRNDRLASLSCHLQLSGNFASATNATPLCTTNDSRAFFRFTPKLRQTVKYPTLFAPRKYNATKACSRAF